MPFDLQIIAGRDDVQPFEEVVLTNESNKGSQSSNHMFSIKTVAIEKQYSDRLLAIPTLIS